MSLTQSLLIIHLLCIAFGMGISLSNIVGFRVAKGLGGDKALGIAAHRESLIPYGDIFYVLIIATGLGLWAAKYNMQVPSPWFHVKMAAVLVWFGGYILMRLRIRKFLSNRNMSLVPMIKTYAHVILTAAVVAVICAVMAFSA